MKALLSHLNRPHHRVIAVGVLAVLVIGTLITVQSVRAEGRILPNVKVGGIDLGGLTPDEAEERLRNSLRALNVSGLSFSNGERSLMIRANEASAAPAAHSPVTYDIEASVAEAFAFGHNEGAGSLLKSNLIALFSSYDLPAKLAVDKVEIENLLKLRFAGLEQPAKDADVRIISSKIALPDDGATSTPLVFRTNVKIEIGPETEGRSFNYSEAIEEALRGLETWRGASVELVMTRQQPGVTVAKAEAFKEILMKIVENGPISLAYDDLTWPLSEETFLKALTLKANPDGSLRVGLRAEIVNPLISEAAEQIETKPSPTKIVLNEDRTRATEFSGGTVGKKINLASSLALIDERVATAEADLVPLVVDITPSSGSDPLAEELGIREMLGYGTSNFAGSPKNRRANIAHAITKLNGLVIKPGEEVGLIEHLRPFEASDGWLPELVIKGNRTVPEYGGGLCQIGTTVFRSVMGAGLPVTQRQNHSFRVRYYEPAGTDATLYDPAPDFKFVNDTGHHAVLVGKIIGDIARFELWGTRDGRVQEQSKVLMLAQTPPPPARLIETSALAEGQKSCFEKPTAGATTTFDYTITYPDGTEKKQTFRSYYKPWQEQCLIGKAGAPRIVMGKDGSINETPVEPSAGTATEAPSTTTPAPATPI